MFKKTIVALSLILTVFNPITSYANSELNTLESIDDIFNYEYNENSEEHIRVKRADQVRWRFRMVDGREQKRLWNFNRNKWMTEWEWV